MNECTKTMISNLIDAEMSESCYIEIYKNMTNDELIKALEQYLEFNNVEIDDIARIIFREILKRMNK